MSRRKNKTTTDKEKAGLRKLVIICYYIHKTYNKWFMKVKIKNVYLGVNFNNNDNKITEKVLDTCRRNGIKTTEMSLSPNNYSLIVKKQ